MILPVSLDGETDFPESAACSLSPFGLVSPLPSHTQLVVTSIPKYLPETVLLTALFYPPVPS